jgi:hypothetical protein
MPDNTNSWNPSPFTQITDTELETKDKIQQEHPPATSVKSRQLQKRAVSHHRQRRVKSIQNYPYSPPTKNLPKIPLRHPPKIKDGALINGKSTSDNESKKSDDSSSSDEESKNSNDSSSSNKESEKSEHSSPKLISIRDIMNGILADSRSV